MLNPMKLLKKNSDILIYLLVVSYFVMMAFLTVLKHATFHSNACDMALCDQIVSNILHGKGPYITFLNKNYLNEHLSLIFFLLAPFYLIYDSPETLLIIQALFLALGALPIYLLAKHVIKDKLSALIFSFIYLISSQLLEAIFFDFHLESFIPFFLIFAFYSGLKKHYICYFICMILAFLVREDVALYGIAIGLYFLIVEKNRKIGIVTTLAGIIWFGLVIRYIRHGVLETRYTYLGTDFSSILKTIILNPFVPLKHIFINSGLPALKLFFKMGFLPFFNLPTLALSFFPLSTTMLSNYTSQYTLYAEYSIPVLTFLYIGSVYGFAKISNFSWQHREIKLRNLILFMIILINIFCLFRFIYRVDKRWFVKDTHVEIGSIALSKISEGVSVSAQTNFLPHLSRHEKNYLFPNINDAEYIIIDTKGNKWPLGKDEYFRKVREVQKNKTYNTIYSNDGIIVFKRSEN